MAIIIETAEQFALDICQNHLDEYEQVINCVVYIEEVPWRRMDNLGSEHNHAFLSSPEAIRFAEVEHDRDETPKIYAGLKDMRIIKTTQFQFLGFFMDDYTSLPESDKWLLSTEVWLKWLYSENTDFDKTWESVKI
ncbi:uricase-like [Amphiura filiformis]|uniref:uricase-like n=1 Tax=Amphiura filiformis TaxID=82378 RepID=UPI003B2128AC